MNKTPIVLSIIMLTVTALVCGACATPSKVADNWGTSYYAQKQGQTVNPDASKNLQPVEGLYGQAAEAAMGQYLKSFSGKAGQGQSSTTGTLGIGYMGQK
jgi:hypothetical protein